MKLQFNQILALAMIALLALIAYHHGLAVTACLAFVCLATLAGTGAIRRGQLGAAPDTHDVASELGLAEILDAAVTSFSRAVLPLTTLSTVFRNVQLKGTDKVQVPYYPIQNAASKDFTGTYNLTNGSGSKTESREITINKRKYQTLTLTGAELARMPYLNAAKLGKMKGEKLAYDVMRDIMSLITAANFPGIAYTGLSSAFDSDDVVDIRTACNKNATGPASVADGVTTNGSAAISSATATFSSADLGTAISGTGIPVGTTIAAVSSPTAATMSANATATATGVTFTITRPIIPWPEFGRGLIVNPDYDGALLKDSNFRRDLTVAGNKTVETAQLPNVYGFDYGQSAAVPDNGENLVGFAAYQSAILAAFSPIEPPPATRKVMTRYEIAVEPVTGISLEFREWGNPGSDMDAQVIECNYGFARGESLALKRIRSAA